MTGDLVTAHALLARVRRWLETDGDDDLGQIERDIVGYLDGVPSCPHCAVLRGRLAGPRCANCSDLCVEAAQDSRGFCPNCSEEGA